MKLVAREKAAHGLVAFHGAIYGLTGSWPHRSRLFRFDPSRHAVRTSPHAFDASRLVPAGGSLWLGVSEGADRRGGSELRRIDPRTLRVTARTTLPVRAVSLAGSGNVLWAGATNRLLRLDPRTGRPERSIEVRGKVGGLAIDRERGLLFDEINPPHQAGLIALEERSPASGLLLHRSTQLEASRIDYGLTSMVPTRFGLWTAFPTGNFGAVELIDRSTLHAVVTHGDAGTNALSVALAGGVLWIPYGAVGIVRCADPATGRVRGWIFRSKTAQALSGDIVALGRRVFAAAWTGIARVDVGPRCRPSR